MAAPTGLLGAPSLSAHPAVPATSQAVVGSPLGQGSPAVAPQANPATPASSYGGSRSSSAPEDASQSQASQALQAAESSLGAGAQCSQGSPGSQTCSWPASIHEPDASSSTWQGGATPPGRLGAMMAYYPPRNEVVLFGGKASNGAFLGDTWTYRGGVWNETNFAGPPARMEGSMIYYPPASEIVLFGGVGSSGTLADTWAFEGEVWVELAEASAPTARYEAAMTYFTGLVKAVLFGGETSAGTQDSDTWFFSGSPGTWAASAITGPSAREGASFADEVQNSEAVLFGGFTNVVGAHNDTWVLTTAPGWVNFTKGLNPEPPARYQASFAWDPSLDEDILTAGFGSLNTLNDTYAWNGGTWVGPINTGDPFSERTLAAMAYDTADSEMILFGGDTVSNGFMNDTWAFSSSEVWSPTHLPPLSPNGPPGRNYDSLAYDATDNAVFLFGGGATHLYNDLWEWQGGVWTNRTSTTSEPPFRNEAGLVWDNGTDTLWLYGGAQYGDNNFLDDLWSYSVATSTWTSQGTGAGFAGARAGFGMVWDPNQGLILIAGGDVLGNFVSSMYTYGPAPRSSGWSSMTSTLPEGGTEGMALVWDSTIGGILDYGGDNGVNNYETTYEIQLTGKTTATSTEISSTDLTGGVSFPWYAYSAVTGDALDLGGYSENGPSIPLSSTLQFSVTGGSWSDIVSSVGTPPDSSGESTLVTDTDYGMFFGAGGSPEYTVPNSGGPTSWFATVPDWIYNTTLTSTLTIPSDLDSGSTLTASFNTISGGSGNDRYLWYGLPPDCSSTSATVSCTPPTVAVNTTYTVQADVVDSLGDVSSHTVAFTLAPPISVSASSVTPSDIDAGQSAVFEVTPTGGSGSYSFTWSNLPSTCTGSGNDFSCTPPTPPANNKTYTVTVAISDSYGGSDNPAATLTLKVNAPISVGLTSSRNFLDSGQQLTYTGVTTKGSGVYTFSWSNLPTGCSNVNDPVITCDPTVAANGSADADLIATDSLGGHGDSGPGLVVIYADPTLGPIHLSASTIDLGQSFTAYVDPKLGDAPYTYVWSGLPAGCGSPTISDFTCTPTSTSGSPFSIGVELTDDQGATATTSNVALTVNAGLSEGPVTITENPVDSGTSVTFSVTVSGGTTPYTYVWANMPSGCPITSSPTITCSVLVLTNTTYYKIYCNVTDAVGAMASSEAAPFVVYADPTLSALTANPTSTDSGQSVTFSATPTGGSGVYTFSWSGLPGGCGDPNEDHLSCALTSALNASVTVTLTLKDSLGTSVTSTLVYSFYSDPTVTKITYVPANVDGGQTVILEATVTGGTGIYTWSWLGLPAGSCSNLATADVTCITTTTLSNTTYDAIQVTVKDSNDESDSLVGSIFQVNGALTVTGITVKNSPLDSGQTLKLEVTATIGSGVYSFLWSNLPTGCSPSNTPTLVCVPSVASNSTFPSVIVEVTDSLGSAVDSAAATVMVNAPVATTPISAVPGGGVDSSDHSVTFSATPTGGSGIYSFSWSNLPSGCSSVDEPKLTCTPSFPTNVTFTTITVTVTDSLSESVTSADSSYNVYEDPSVSAIHYSANPAESNSTLWLWVVPSDGSGTYDFAWSGLPAFCTSSAKGFISCTPAVHENFTFSGLSVCLTDSGFGDVCDAASSFEALVGITVAPIVANPAGGQDGGQVVSFTTSATGGDGGYGFAWTNLPAGCSPSNVRALTCTPTAPAGNTTYAHVEVTVTDALGAQVTSAQISYIIRADPVATTPSAVPNPSDSGLSVTFSTVPTLGTGVYSFAWSGLPTGCTAVSEPKITCAPTTGASNTTWPSVSVTVSDGELDATPAATSFQVDAPPQASSITLTPNRADFDSGQTFTLSVTPTLGTGVYQFLWSGLPTGCSTQNNRVISCTPSVPSNETFASVDVKVTDSDGLNALALPISLTIYVAPSVSGIAITPVGGIDAGSSGITFSATPSGGSGTYSFAWSGLPAGCGGPSLPRFTCLSTDTVNWTGTTIMVTLTDSLGVNANSPEATYEIYQDPALSALTATPNPVDSGTTILLHALPSEGDGMYSFTWASLPSFCSAQDTNYLTCDTSVAINTTFSGISLCVQDSTGMASACSTLSSLQVYVAPAISSITANPAVGQDYGLQVTFSAVPSGGEAGYSFSWSGLPGACAGPDLPTVTCTIPDVASNTTLSVRVAMTDSLGNAVKSPILSYIEYGVLTVSAITVTPATVDSGQTMTFSASASFGDGVYTWSWLGLPTGCVSSNTPVITCIAQGGPFNMTHSGIIVNVVDGTGTPATSAAASVTINALPQVSSVTASPFPVESGQTLTLSVTATEGSGVYAFLWSGLPTGCSSMNTPVLTCVPGVGSNTTFSSIVVAVTDSFGITVNSASATDTVLAHVTASAIAPSHWETDVGESVTFDLTARLGDGGYGFAWSGLPAGCSPANQPSIVCVPTAQGTGPISVTVSDALGVQASSGTLVFTVVAPLAAGALSANQTSFDQGNLTLLSLAPSAGLGPYTFLWQNLPAGCTSTNTTTLSCDPSVTGTFWVRVLVSDVLGGTNESTAVELSVASTPVPSVSPSRGSSDIGQTVTFTATVVGGVGGLIYLWSGLPAGCQAKDLAALVCTPTASGTTSPTVLVVDAQGGKGAATLTYTVYSDPSVSVQSPSGTATETGISLTLVGTLTGGSPGTFTYVWLLNGTTPVVGGDDTSTYVFDPAHGGTYSFTLSATDANGETQSGISPSISVVMALSVSIRSGFAQVLDVGQGTSLSATFVGGAGSLTWTWYDDGTALASACTTASCAYLSSKSGAQWIWANATDADGVTAMSNVASILVNPAPSVTLSPTSATTSEGTGVVLTATIMGGTPGFTYGWYANESSLPQQNGSSKSFTFESPHSASYQIWVVVNDSLGAFARSPITTVVVSGPALASVGIVLSIAGTSGNSISLDGVSHGANGSVSLPVDGSYALTVSPGSGYAFVRWETTGGVNVESSTATATTLTLAAPGTLTAVFAATSHTGGQGSPGGFSALLTSSTGIVLLVLILVIAAIAAALLLRRRKQPSSSARQEDAGEGEPGAATGPASAGRQPVTSVSAGPATPSATPPPPPPPPTTPAPAAPKTAAGSVAGSGATSAAALAAATAAAVGASTTARSEAVRPSEEWSETPEESWQEEEATSPATSASATPAAGSEAPASTPVEAGIAATPAVTSAPRPKMVMGAKGAKPVEAAGATVIAKEPPWPMVPLTVVEATDKARFWRMAAASGLERTKMLILSPEAPGIINGTYGMHGATIYRLSRTEGDQNVSPGDADRIGYLIESHLEKGSGRAVVIDGIASIIDTANIRTARRLVELTHEMAEKTSGAALVWINPDTMGQVERRQIEEKAVVRRLR